MSPRRKGARGGSGWKPPRDRHEIVVAVLASLAVIVATASLVWFVRPNRESSPSSPTVNTVVAPTTAAGATTTTAAPVTTAAP